jgi:arylsulfatase A-like enzyme
MMIRSNKAPDHTAAHAAVHGHSTCFQSSRWLCLVIALLSLPITPALGDDVPAPNVFFITIDTLRADHLGSYGYAHDTSPNIDTFAQGAILFETAISQAPNTIPSILQIMTSRYGLSGRIRDNQTTLAELLQRHGYETVAVVDNPLFEFDEAAHGLMRGFDRFYRNSPLDREVLEEQHYKSNTPADVVTAQAGRVLDRRKTGAPLFLWLHYFDPHDPYAPPFAEDLEKLSRGSKSTLTGDIRKQNFIKGLPPKPEPRDVAHIVALYDAEIRYADASLGEFFDRLKREGLYDSSLIILSSDHGESLGEHDIWMHGHSLYDAEIRIPLIVKLPHQKRGRRIKRPVQAIDIVPTIDELLAIETDVQFDGASLLVDSKDPALTLWHKHKVVLTEKWKLYEFGKEVFLYRINGDPGETKNVAAKHPRVVEELRQAREARLDRIDQNPKEIHQLTTEAVEQMRALGYIE